MKQESRNLYLDMLRGMAILIVVYGHALHACNNMILDHKVHWVIQTFQMPLLMLVSGYTAGFGEPVNHIASCLYKKVLRLLIPYAIWSQLHYIMMALIHHTYRVGNQLLSLLNSQFWFLRILFIIYLAYYLFYFIKQKLDKNPVIGLIVAWIVAGLCLVLFRFIPGCGNALVYSIYFLLGNILYKVRVVFSNRYVRMLHAFSIPVFAICIVLYFTVDHALLSFLIDKTMAICGSACVASVTYLLYRFVPWQAIKNYLVRTGANTLPIYAVHWVILYSLNISFARFFPNLGIPICLQALITTLIWMLCCDLVIAVMSRNRVLSLLFLGVKKKS